MPTNFTRRTILATALSSLAVPALSAPQRYRLVTEKSTVAFRFNLNGTTQTGTVPVQTADIWVDTARLENSSAVVTADIRKAQTGFVFVTQALLGASVLDAATHPIVSFTSTRIRLGTKGRISEGATMEGLLSLRGQRRPVSLRALLSRPAGTAPDDLSTLFIQLDGSLNRSDFGATGYAGIVADTVTLNIRAEIRANR